jgi:hypothetical protein
MSWRGVNPFETVASAMRAGVPARVRRLGVWGVIAALLAVGGVVGTVFVARSVSRADAQRSHQAFTHASSQVASTLRLAIAREKDLVVSAGVFELENPNASNADLKRWGRREGAFGRYPELVGIATLAFVPRSGLAAFEARAEADPVGPLGPGGSFAVVPSGVRPYYCFLSRVQDRRQLSPIPAGIDYCTSVPELIASRASGKGYAYAISIPQVSKTPLLNIATPLYRGGGVPATLAQRTSAFLGWTGIVVAPRLLLDSALEGQSGRRLDCADL